MHCWRFGIKVLGHEQEYSLNALHDGAYACLDIISQIRYDIVDICLAS
jgi:hypothetical protein